MTNSSVKSISSYMLIFFLLLIPIKSVAADGQGYPGGGWINLQGPKPPVPGAKTYSEFWTTQSKHLIVSNSLVKISSYFTGLEYVECSYWYTYTDVNGKESKAQGVQYYSIECWEVYLNGIPNSLTMQVGDVETIKWSYSPNNIDTPKLEWSSSNYNVVDVNSSGRIEAKGNGTAVITVKNNVCPTKYINVTVSGGTGIVYVSSISLSESNSTLNVGNTKQLTATVLPTNATDKSVTWSSNNSSVASVSSSGLVTAKAVGTATIACQANDGSGKSATCSITVKSSTVDPLSIVLPNYTENIKVGETITLTPTIAPSNATTTLTWESSNTAVATVTQNGVVKGLKVGESKITVTTHNGKSAYCYVKVADNVIYVTSISLNATSVTLTEGNTKQLEATVSPNNATNKTVTWSSDNTSVATVSSSGLVTAKSAGSATITCKAVDGSGKQATCSVTVKSSTVEPTGITISPSSKTITVGETFYASYTLTPSNATTTVTWSSDNSSIASVSSSGLVTGKKVGSTYINAKTSNGKTDWCKVTVEETSKPKLTLSASPSGGSVEKGTKVYLTVKADGSNVYGCDIYYTLNGTTPTKSSTKYTSSGITINSDCTLKAIAYKSGYDSSDELTETYTIQDKYGSIFTATIPGNIEMTFKVISAADMTCQVGEGSYNHQAIDTSIAGEITIPSVVNGYSVVQIGHGAFRGCEGVTSVNMPNNIIEIGYNAFSECSSLESINIPTELKAIGSSAFQNCINLASPIIIPEGVKTIESATFFCCDKLSSVTLPSTLTIIEERAFQSCAVLESINFPDGLTAIGEYAFFDCPIKSIHIPARVSSIAKDAFSYCGRHIERITVASGNTVYDSRGDCNAIIETGSNTLFIGCKNTIIPYGITSIGDDAFELCSGLTNIILPEGLKTIGNDAFRGAGLTSLFLPEGVVSIGKSAFNSNYLNTISIPKSVVSIGEKAFASNRYNSHNGKIYSYAIQPIDINENVFDEGGYRWGTLYVPQGSKSKYESAEGWKNFKNIVEFDPSNIEVVTVPGAESLPTHNLSGQRLTAPKKGINIIGGKKVVVK